jgi:glycine cleavage system aminomethyltransferase T
VWGPRARDLLGAVSEEDLSNTGFPYLTAQRVAIGEVPALALRISYVGELGWEVYAPMAHGLKLWDILWAAAEPLEGAAAGNGALDSLRLEKGYRSWGADIHTDYHPYEAGLGFAVRRDKGDFVGREALERIRSEGIERKLCCMTLADPSKVVMGKEPILDGEEVLGYVTSANYGYSVGQSIVYGYLPRAYSQVGTQVEIAYFGERFPATVVKEPLYDPENAKLLG